MLADIEVGVTNPRVTREFSVVQNAHEFYLGPLNFSRPLASKIRIPVTPMRNVTSASLTWYMRAISAVDIFRRRASKSASRGSNSDQANQFASSSCLLL